MNLWTVANVAAVVGFLDAITSTAGIPNILQTPGILRLDGNDSDFVEESQCYGM